MREAERCFPALLAPRKLFLPKRSYCQLQAVDFCLACLGFCSGSVAFLALTRSYGYGYNRWLLLFLQVCGISCIPPRFKRDGSRGKWAAVAVQLVECGNPACRQSKLLMSVRPWLRVELQHELRVPATSYALLPDCASRQWPRGTYFY